MKTTGAWLIPVCALLAAAVLTGPGCDRQDNDWGTFDPGVKQLHVITDTLTVTEGGGGADFQVSLAMVPADTVLVIVTPDLGQTTVDPDTIFFAPVDDDWANPRRVRVWAVDDAVAETAQADALTVWARSRDSVYDGQGGAALVPVAVTDNDGAGVAVSETVLTLVESELGAMRERYRLTLSSQPQEPVTVTVTAVPALANLHLEPPFVEFDAQNWNVPQEIELWSELDDTDNNDHQVVLEHAAASADADYGPDLAIPAVDLTILDDTLPPIVRLRLADPAVDTLHESDPGTGVAVEVYLDRASQVEVTIHVATRDGTATAVADYEPVDTDLAFAVGGPITRTITLYPVDGPELEFDEEFEVAITAVQQGILGDADRLTLAIRDDDVTNLTLSTTDTAEDEGAADFTVSMPSAEPVPVEFTFRTADGSARAGSDYDAIDFRYRLEPGATQLTIPVVLVADENHEDDETLTGSLIDLSANAAWAGVPVVCTILDDDPQAVVLADVVVEEGAGPAVFTIELENSYGTPVVLTVGTLSGDGEGDPAGQEDATAGQDFAAVTAGTWTIPALATSATFNVAVNADGAAEATHEVFRLEITNADQPGFAGLTARCTVVDRDQPCLAPTDIVVDESAAEAVFHVALQDEVGQPVTSSADVLLRAATEDQTASAGADYTPYDRTVTIPAGSAGVDIVIPLSDDGHDDDNETFVLLLTEPVNAAGACVVDHAFCTIVDDEFPSLNLGETAHAMNEGSTYDFSVFLTTPRQSPTTFTLDVAPGTSGGAGVDYAFAGNGLQTITPYQTHADFSIEYLDDQLAGENDETLSISINAANVALGVIELAPVVIDAPELTIFAAAALEGNDAVFDVSLDATSTADVTFFVQFSSGTAITGNDFSTAGVGPYTIPAGGLSTTVPVPTIADDGGDATVEDFIVTLVNPLNAVVGPFGSAVGEITDGDPPPVFFTGPAGALEGADIEFTAALGWTSEVDVSFQVSFTDGSAVRAGIDYSDADTGPFTIPAGALGVTVPVPTIADGQPEPTFEDFTITIVAPVNGVVGAPAAATGTIEDGDQPELTIPAAETATEGAVLSFTIHLSEQTIVPVFFGLEYDDGSTQGAGDYDATATGPFSMMPGTVDTTITVPTVDDPDYEIQEAFIVRIVSDPVNAVRGDPFENTGTIDDDDP